MAVLFNPGFRQHHGTASAHRNLLQRRPVSAQSQGQRVPGSRESLFLVLEAKGQVLSNNENLALNIQLVDKFYCLVLLAQINILV